MNGRFGAVLMFVLGAVVAQQVVFHGYLDYVKPAQGPWLLAAGLVLAGCGLIGMLAEPDSERERPAVHTHGPLAAPPEVIAKARRERREAERDDHRRAPGVAVLLLVPLVMALGVAPPALGAFTAARSGAAVPAPVARRAYVPLPTVSTLPVHDYAERAAWDDGRTLAGRSVTLVGFVTPEGDARWYLTRIMITCCAADSRSYLVAVDGGGRPPVANTWQRVTGTWVASPPVDGRPTARIAATAVTAIRAPAEPYELP